MRALPFELLRRGVARVRVPERGAVVMRDGEPEALGANAGPRPSRAFEHMLAPLAVREGLLPADQAYTPFGPAAT